MHETWVIASMLWLLLEDEALDLQVMTTPGGDNAHHA